MKQPKFTDDEEKMIAYILNNEDTAGATLALYAPWLIISVGAFGYGAYTANMALMVVGFILAFFLCLRFVFYQLKPSWNVKSIIEKYQETINEGCQQEDELA